MTSRFKDFGEDSNVVREPLSFKLYGEEFNCHPAIQGKVLLEMVKEAGDENNPSAAAGMIDNFFSTALFPESYERFDKLVRDPEKIVTVETLSEITGWLVGEYAERPTMEPERSSNGQ
jgi:hypothetical protein